MKILLFEGGLPGRRVDILGENVQAELEELLGGPIVWETLTTKLHLVTRADAAAEGLPVRYGRYLSGRETDRLQGDAVVVKVGHGGGAQDVTRDDMERADLLIRPHD